MHSVPALLVVLLLAVAEQAGGMDTWEACEWAIAGYFTDPATDPVGIDTLYLRARQDDCSQGIYGWKQPEDDWALYDSAYDASARQQPVVDADILNSEDYATLIDVCRDPDTELDQLRFTLERGGTSNGDAKDALFAFYDSGQGRFFTLLLASQFVDDSCSLLSSRQRLQRFEAKAWRRRALYRSLRPASGNGERINARALPDFQPLQVRNLIQELDRQEQFEMVPDFRTGR